MESKECGICFDLVNVFDKMNCCEHIFCYACIEKWSEEKNVCPHCGKRFTRLEKVEVDLNEPDSDSKKKERVIETIPKADIKDCDLTRQELSGIGTWLQNIPEIMFQDFEATPIDIPEYYQFVESRLVDLVESHISSIELYELY
jgi:hypothetical protein